MLTGDSQNLIPVPSLDGTNVNVVRLNMDIHLQCLWEAQTKYKEAACGNDPNEDLMFTHMMYGPFRKVEEFEIHLRNLLKIVDLYPYVIEYKGKDDSSAAPVVVGFVTYMEVKPEHRKCEIGHLWLDPRYRRRNIMDEAIYLMLKHAFEGAKYRRVQWTCNNANEPSKKMALRNQFKFEGITRNYFIGKGVNRDNTWLSIIDSEWEEAKQMLESRIK